MQSTYKPHYQARFAAVRLRVVLAAYHDVGSTLRFLDRVAGLAVRLRSPDLLLVAAELREAVADVVALTRRNQ